MAMPWSMTLWISKMVWLALAGWISSCLIVADEVASSIRTGDIGAFHSLWSLFELDNILLLSNLVRNSEVEYDSLCRGYIHAYNSGYMVDNLNLELADLIQVIVRYSVYSVPSTSVRSSKNCFEHFLSSRISEAILMAVTKSVVEKLASFAADLALTSATEEIRAAKAARKDLKTMASKLSVICAVLEDAERRQYANESIKIWLRDLKDVVYDIDDLLDEVSTYALQRTANEGHLLIQLSNKIKDLREKLDDIVAKKNDFGLTEHPVEITHVERNPLDTCAYVNMSDIIGRDEARQDVVNILSAIGGARNHPPVLPIVGLGGVGKTALAKLVYHDEWVVRAFDIKLWACLGRVLEKLQDLLRGKKYFLVLDDIWLHDIALWTEFKNMLAVGNDESVILVTTRHANVASVIGTVKPYYLAGLSDHCSWSIFEQLAFIEGDEQRYPDLVQIGRSIVKKCVGVPLLVKTLASFLRNERNKSEWLQVDRKTSLVEVQTQCTNVMRILKLSYDKLPSHSKPSNIRDCRGSKIGFFAG
uniref:Uncharacterized protein n=1 Tax=Chenopodium quinoa TaxID=63459 RepID=A0A803MM31_CHEQI